VEGRTAASAVTVRNAYFEALLHSLICALVAGFRRPQVVHIHGIGPAPVVPLLRILGLRVIVTHHGEDYSPATCSRTAHSRSPILRQIPVSIIAMRQSCLRIAEDLDLVAEARDDLVGVGLRFLGQEVFFDDVRLVAKAKDEVLVAELAVVVPSAKGSACRRPEPSASGCFRIRPGCACRDRRRTELFSSQLPLQCELQGLKRSCNSSISTRSVSNIADASSVNGVVPDLAFRGGRSETRARRPITRGKSTPMCSRGRTSPRQLPNQGVSYGYPSEQRRQHHAGARSPGHLSAAFAHSLSEESAAYLPWGASI